MDHQTVARHIGRAGRALRRFPCPQPTSFFSKSIARTVKRPAKRPRSVRWWCYINRRPGQLRNLIDLRARCGVLLAVDNSPAANTSNVGLLGDHGIDYVFNGNRGGIAGPITAGSRDCSRKVSMQLCCSIRTRTRAPIISGDARLVRNARRTCLRDRSKNLR